MRYRALGLLLIVLAVQSVVDAVEVQEVFSGMANPASLVLGPSVTGDSPALLIAESGKGRVLSWSLGQEPESLFTGLGTDAPLRLAYAEGVFLVADSHVTVYSQTADRGQPLREITPGTQAIRSLATDPRYLFVLRGEQLLRSRRSNQRFTTLRPHQVKTLEGATALCFGERGHLIVAHATAGDIPRRLTFHDPHTASAPSSITIEEIDHPIAIGLGPHPRPTERPLYALATGSEGEGLYRLDALPPQAGTLRCLAVFVAPIEQPVAFTATPDGSIYVITHLGQLLRLTGDL